jgi:hypothetical protein
LSCFQVLLFGRVNGEEISGFVLYDRSWNFFSKSDIIVEFKNQPPFNRGISTFNFEIQIMDSFIQVRKNIPMSGSGRCKTNSLLAFEMISTLACPV